MEMQTASVVMSVYDWHWLLSELEFAMKVCNRENAHVPVDLYQKIATQLAETAVVVGGTRAPNDTE